MTTVIGKVRAEKLDASAFLAQADAGIAQAETDATTIASAATLAELKPVLARINNRQLEIMKALRYLTRRLE